MNTNEIILIFIYFISFIIVFGIILSFSDKETSIFNDMFNWDENNDSCVN